MNCRETSSGSPRPPVICISPGSTSTTIWQTGFLLIVRAMNFTSGTRAGNPFSSTRIPARIGLVVPSSRSSNRICPTSTETCTASWNLRSKRCTWKPRWPARSCLSLPFSSCGSVSPRPSMRWASIGILIPKPNGFQKTQRPRITFDLPMVSCPTKHRHSPNSSWTESVPCSRRIWTSPTLIQRPVTRSTSTPSGVVTAALKRSRRSTSFWSIPSPRTCVAIWTSRRTPLGYWSMLSNCCVTMRMYLKQTTGRIVSVPLRWFRVSYMDYWPSNTKHTSAAVDAFRWRWINDPWSRHSSRRKRSIRIPRWIRPLRWVVRTPSPRRGIKDPTLFMHIATNRNDPMTHRRSGNWPSVPPQTPTLGSPRTSWWNLP